MLIKSLYKYEPTMHNPSLDSKKPATTAPINAEETATTTVSPPTDSAMTVSTPEIELPAFANTPASMLGLPTTSTITAAAEKSESTLTAQPEASSESVIQNITRAQKPDEMMPLPAFSDQATVIPWSAPPTSIGGIPTTASASQYSLAVEAIRTTEIPTSFGQSRLSVRLGPSLQPTALDASRDYLGLTSDTTAYTAFPPNDIKFEAFPAGPAALSSNLVLNQTNNTMDFQLNSRNIELVKLWGNGTYFLNIDFKQEYNAERVKAACEKLVNDVKNSNFFSPEQIVLLEESVEVLYGNEGAQAYEVARQEMIRRQDFILILNYYLSYFEYKQAIQAIDEELEKSRNHAKVLGSKYLPFENEYFIKLLNKYKLFAETRSNNPLSDEQQLFKLATEKRWYWITPYATLGLPAFEDDAKKIKQHYESWLNNCKKDNHALAKVKVAYEILGSKHKRAEYNDLLKQMIPILDKIYLLLRKNKWEKILKLTNSYLPTASLFKAVLQNFKSFAEMKLNLPQISQDKPESSYIVAASLSLDRDKLSWKNQAYLKKITLQFNNLIFLIIIEDATNLFIGLRLIHNNVEFLPADLKDSYFCRLITIMSALSTRIFFNRQAELIANNLLAKVYIENETVLHATKSIPPQVSNPSEPSDTLSYQTAIVIPPHIKEIMKKISAAGGKVYISGSWVTQQVAKSENPKLNIHTADFNLVTDLDPLVLEKILPEAQRDIHVEHYLFTFQDEIDITCRPELKESIKADAQKSDLSAYRLYLDAKSVLHAPFNGQGIEDIKSGETSIIANLNPQVDQKLSTPVSLETILENEPQVILHIIKARADGFMIDAKTLAALKNTVRFLTTDTKLKKKYLYFLYNKFFIKKDIYRIINALLELNLFFELFPLPKADANNNPITTSEDDKQLLKAWLLNNAKVTSTSVGIGHTHEDIFALLITPRVYLLTKQGKKLTVAVEETFKDYNLPVLRVNAYKRLSKKIRQSISLLNKPLNVAATIVDQKAAVPTNIATTVPVANNPLPTPTLPQPQTAAPSKAEPIAVNSKPSTQPGLLKVSNEKMVEIKAAVKNSSTAIDPSLADTATGFSIAPGSGTVAVTAENDSKKSAQNNSELDNKKSNTATIVSSATNVLAETNPNTDRKHSITLTTTASAAQMTTATPISTAQLTPDKTAALPAAASEIHIAPKTSSSLIPLAAYLDGESKDTLRYQTTIKIPPPIKETMKKIADAGGKVFITGYWVVREIAKLENSKLNIHVFRTALITDLNESQLNEMFVPGAYNDKSKTFLFIFKEKNMVIAHCSKLKESIKAVPEVSDLIHTHLYLDIESNLYAPFNGKGIESIRSGQTAFIVDPNNKTDEKSSLNFSLEKTLKKEPENILEVIKTYVDDFTSDAEILNILKKTVRLLTTNRNPKKIPDPHIYSLYNKYFISINPYKMINTLFELNLFFELFPLPKADANNNNSQQVFKNWVLDNAKLISNSPSIKLTHLDIFALFITPRVYILTTQGKSPESAIDEAFKMYKLPSLTRGVNEVDKRLLDKIKDSILKLKEALNIIPVDQKIATRADANSPKDVDEKLFSQLDLIKQNQAKLDTVRNSSQTNLTDSLTIDPSIVWMPAPTATASITEAPASDHKESVTAQTLSTSSNKVKATKQLPSARKVELSEYLSESEQERSLYMSMIFEAESRSKGRWEDIEDNDNKNDKANITTTGQRVIADTTTALTTALQQSFTAATMPTINNSTQTLNATVALPQSSATQTTIANNANPAAAAPTVPAPVVTAMPIKNESNNKAAGEKNSQQNLPVKSSTATKESATIPKTSAAVLTALSLVAKKPVKNQELAPQPKSITATPPQLHH